MLILSSLFDFFNLIGNIFLLLFIIASPFIVSWTAYLGIKLKNRENLVQKILHEESTIYNAKLHWSYLLPPLTLFSLFKVTKLVSTIWDFFSLRILVTNTRIIIIKGLVKPRIREIPLYSFININTELSFSFGTKCGRVTIYHGERTYLESILNPLMLKEFLISFSSNIKQNTILGIDR
jgi:hypothetical protein